MPQAFYQAGQRRYAYQLTDEEYREIQQYTRTDRHHILSAINNEPVFLKISPRGRKFVSHYPNGEHTTDKESSEHFNTKTRVYDSLRAAGYRAEMEHLIPLNDEGDYIIADTVCFFPEEHIPPVGYRGAKLRPDPGRIRFPHQQVPPGRLRCYLAATQSF